MKISQDQLAVAVCEPAGGDQPTRCEADPTVIGSIPPSEQSAPPSSGNRIISSPSTDPTTPADALASTDTRSPLEIDQQQSLDRIKRASVMPQVATASDDLVGTIAPRGMPVVVTSIPDRASPSERRRNSVQTISLNDAVAVAVLSHPLMGAQAAKVHAAHADVRYAEGARKPSLEIYGGSGQSAQGTYANWPTHFGEGSVPGTSRTDVGFTFKQLIYDFGAARAEVARNRALVDAEKLRLADQAEDIALRTVNAYLNLLEQSELISLIDKTVKHQRELAGLVTLSQQNGNGTKADVDRIQAKVIETEAMRSDINTAYHTALDEFHRLTNLEPKQVRRPTSQASLIPKSLDQAILDAQAANPSLLSLKETGTSISHQLSELQAQSMPRIDLQSDGLVKHYIGVHPASQGVVDMRAMVMLSYKLMDGGMLSAQTDRIRANQRANEFKILDEQETVELNLRRFYQALTANRAKRDAAARGITTANSVNALYIEQFKAGKRTIFEILDSNMMVFTMQKNRINGEYEEMRASYGILRNLGKLAETISRT